MIVQTLGHQLEGEWVLLAGRFLDFGALVLEPDLDLCLVQPQLRTQLLATALGKVPILGKLVLGGGRRKIKQEKARLN